MKNATWVLRNSAITTLTNLFITASGFLLSVLLARALGPHDRGLFAIFLVAGEFVFNLTNLGVYAGTNYYISTSKLKPTEIVSNGIVLNGLLSLAACTLILLAAIGFNQFFDYPWQLLVLLILSVPTLLLTATFNAVLYGSKKVLWVTGWNLFYALLQIVVFSLVLLASNQNLYLALQAQVGLMYVNCIGLSVLALRATGLPRPLRLYQPRAFLKYSSAVFVGRIMQFLSYRVDNLFVTAMLGPAAMGFYSIAVSTAEQIWIIPNSINLLLMPTFGRSKTAEASTIAAQISRNVIFLMLLCSIAMACIVFPFIPLVYGSEYAPAAWPLLYLLPGVIGLSLFKVFEPYCQSQSKPHIPMIASILAIIVNIICNFILTPTMGINGTALSSTLSYTVQAVVVVYGFRKLSATPLQNILLLNGEDVNGYRRLLRQFRPALVYSQFQARFINKA